METLCWEECWWYSNGDDEIGNTHAAYTYAVFLSKKIDIASLVSTCGISANHTHG